jgi:2-succinyl-6-hydroxy-2,4-cyclohexadiene-1-carboxylate synthase
VLVNGVNLNIKVVGSGPPVVALHGFAGNMSTWSYFAEEAQQEYTLVTVDLLGHGGSDSPKEDERYSVEHSANDISAILHNLGIYHTCWLGYSMGGRIALASATLNPKTCECLIVESASPGLSSKEEREERVRSDSALARFIEEEGVEAFTNYWEQQPLFASQKQLPSETREHIRNQRLRNNAIGLANALRAAGSGAQPPVHNLLSALKIPVLCIAGQNDPKYCSIARDMCNQLPNVRVSIIPGTGHAPHLEKPEEFNRIVLDFLRECYKNGSMQSLK